MSSDQKLDNQISEYQAIAKENPNVDIGLLMMNALQTQKQNEVSPKAKRWAYLVSIGAPPMGLIWAIKYYFSDEDDAKTVAWMCIILTAASLLMYWISYKLFFGSTNVTPTQIEQIKPSDVQQLLQ